jgi:hypothetical protein
MSTCILDGAGQRFCVGNGLYGNLGIGSFTANNAVPAATVIPTALRPTAFATPPPFVTISDSANAPVCSLLLSVKVAATCDPSPTVFDPALADIAVDGTSAAGAIVTYNPTANKGGTPVAVTCSPPSGSQFAVGPTTVTCTAGTTTGTFTVRCSSGALLFSLGGALCATRSATIWRRMQFAVRDATIPLLALDDTLHPQYSNPPFPPPNRR